MSPYRDQPRPAESRPTGPTATGRGPVLTDGQRWELVFRWRPWHQWCLGFFLTANVYLVPALTLSPRATDLIALLLSLWILNRLASSGMSWAPLIILLAFNLMPMAWLAYAFLTGDDQTLVLAIRWLLALPWGLALVHILQAPDARRVFLYGMMWGMLANVGVILLQAAGLDDTLRTLGLSTSDTDFSQRVYRTVRFPGLHGHHNASASVISLIVPVSLALYFRYRASVWLPVVGLGALMIAIHFTSTRSALLVAAVTFVSALLWVRRPRRALTLLTLAGGLAIVFFAVVGPPGGKLRWADLVSTEENVGGRLTTNVSALRLSLEHPLGMGVKTGREELIADAAIPATHNAFLQASLFFGLLPALILCVLFTYLVFQILRGEAGPDFWIGVFALHLGGLFLFEEHLNNATFMILTNWLLAAGVVQITGDQLAGADQPEADPGHGGTA